MKPSILIAGSSGYLGSALYERFKHEGFRVSGVSRSQIDLVDTNKTNRFVKSVKPEIVIHSAGSTKITFGSLTADQDMLMASNVEVTRSVLNAAVSSNVKLFIYISSLSVYGDPQTKRVREDHPLEPGSFYAVTKLLGETLVESFARMSKMKAYTLRSMGIFGGTRRSGLIHSWIDQALKNQTISVPRGVSLPWNIISIDDLTDGIYLAAKKKPAQNYSVLNIGYDRPVDLKELAREIIRLTDSKSKITFVKRGKNMPFAYDMSKTFKELHWRPKPLKQRIAEYIDLIKQ